MPIQLIEIGDLLTRVNNNHDGIFRKIPEPIVILCEDISSIIGDDSIFLSEFVIAKVKGKIPLLSGHPEITDEIIISLPSLIQFPLKIFQDTRANNKYLFIIAHPSLEVVIEVKRLESGKTEINTFHKIGIDEIKRLERKFPVVL